MKCLACGYEHLEDGAGACPVCKFPVIYVTADNIEANHELLERMVGDYRKKSLDEVKISMLVYYYEMKNKELEIREEKLIDLALASELTDKMIKWYPEQFARIEEETIKLTVQIQKFNQLIKTKELTLKVPKTKGLWKIGIIKNGELAFKLVVGNEENVTESENVDFFE